MSEELTTGREMTLGGDPKRLRKAVRRYLEVMDRVRELDKRGRLGHYRSEADTYLDAAESELRAALAAGERAGSEER